jgi:hypothetical protein
MCWFSLTRAPQYAHHALVRAAIYGVVAQLLCRTTDLRIARDAVCVPSARDRALLPLRVLVPDVDDRTVDGPHAEAAHLVATAAAGEALRDMLSMAAPGADSGWLAVRRSAGVYAARV